MQKLIEFIGNHPVLVGAFLAVLTFIVINEIRRKSGSRQIDAREAVRIINDEDAIILDIREPGDYKTGHIINAKNIPASRLGEDAEKLGTDKNRPVIVYCKTGLNSQSACGKLREAGYTRVYCLKNGLYGWQEENMPIQR